MGFGKQERHSGDTVGRELVLTRDGRDSTGLAASHRERRRRDSNISREPQASGVDKIPRYRHEGSEPNGSLFLSRDGGMRTRDPLNPICSASVLASLAPFA